MSASLITQPDLRGFAERVWRARNTVYGNRGINLTDSENVVIVISEATYAALLAEWTRARTQPAFGFGTPFTWAAEPTMSRDEAIKMNLRCFGVLVLPGAGLEDHEIRFRAEVSA